MESKKQTRRTVRDEVDGMISFFHKSTTASDMFRSDDTAVRIQTGAAMIARQSCDKESGYAAPPCGDVA